MGDYVTSEMLRFYHCNPIRIWLQFSTFLAWYYTIIYHFFIFLYDNDVRKMSSLLTTFCKFAKLYLYFFQWYIYSYSKLLRYTDDQYCSAFLT